MRHLVLCALLGVLAVTTVRAESDQMDAYAALLLAGRERGDALLATLVEMRGIDGEPQPRRWTMSFRDETARGGIREIIVSPKGIVGERTPLRPAAQGSAVMTARDLKLNSTGAFEAANREAARARLGFHSLNYRLFNRQGAPVWLLQLFEVGGSEVGQIEFSAVDGTMLSGLRTPAPGQSPPADVAPDPVPAPAAPEILTTPDAPAPIVPPGATSTVPAPAMAEGASDNRTLGERWIEGGGLVGHMERLGERSWEATTNTASRMGDSIGAFFLGRPASYPPAGN